MDYFFCHVLGIGCKPTFSVAAVTAPEIDASNGLVALATLIAGMLLAYELRRRA